MNILLISKDNSIIDIVKNFARSNGDHLLYTSDIIEAKKDISGEEYDAVLMDCSIRPTELISLANEMQEILSEVIVLLIGPVDHEQREILGRRLSAHYSIDKPLRNPAFPDVMRKVKLRSLIVKKSGLVSRSPLMEEIIQTTMQIAPTTISVLITGESGSGKEVVARAIHSVSNRSEMPFLALNCAALAEGVLESELFGHEKGSFTGAAGRRIGLFEKADKGTIFLDEIGEIPHSTQIRLLRVLEEHEIMRVGGTDIIPVDVRVIAATNRNLDKLVEKGTFRRDLYYRIKVLEINVPPLRKRPEDIPILIERIIKNYTAKNKIKLRKFDDEMMSFMSRAYWSGNVRELRNFIESCLAITNSRIIGVKDIPEYMLNEISYSKILPVPAERFSEKNEKEFLYRTLLDLKNDISEIKQLILREKVSENEPSMEVAQVIRKRDLSLENREHDAILDALEQTNGNRRKAAEILGIGERTLYRKLKQYGIM